MLQVEEINQYYGSSHTCAACRWNGKGQVHGAAGRNGVGKTTLLKCLMGVLPVSAGSVRLEGRDITRMAPHQRARAGIAYVPQGREIFARLTVEENLLMGWRHKRQEGLDHQGRGVRAVPGAEGHAAPARRRPVRRPAAAAGDRARLLAEPKLIILDEPTEGIQPSIIKDIGNVIRLLRQRGDMAICCASSTSILPRSWPTSSSCCRAARWWLPARRRR
jgi:urea transport system ATP-binding protein